MNSRQRVRKTLEFDHPDRIPRQLWSLPIVAIENGRPAFNAFRARWPDDIITAPGNAPPSPLRRGDWFKPGRHTDDWGCEFLNIIEGVHGEVKDPFLADLSRLDDLRPPLESLQIDTPGVNALCRATDAWVMGGCCPRPFERLQFLRGSENLYLDLAEETPEILELLRRVHAFYCRELDVWSKTDVDSLMFMDDWGSQRSLLISPAQWRRLFKPLYRDYVRIAHEAGKKIFMHSDGFIFDIYPDLIEIGVDAVNSQLFCMDIENIGRRFKGKITFWGEIDRQHLLPFGTPAEIRAAVDRVAAALYSPAGGLIAQFELGPGAKIPNADAAFQRWLEIGGQ